MDYGIKVTNENNDVQIDSQYRNMVVLGRGVATTPWTVRGCGDRRFKIPFNFSENPEAIIAVRPRGQETICSIGKSGSEFFVITKSPGTDEALDYIIYGIIPPGGSTQAYGLLVYSPSGVKVFDSSFEYMKITDVMVFPVGSSSSYRFIVTKNIPSGKEGLYFLTVTSACSSEQFGPQSRGYFPAHTGFTNDGKIIVDNMTDHDIPEFTVFLVDPS